MRSMITPIRCVLIMLLVMPFLACNRSDAQQGGGNQGSAPVYPDAQTAATRSLDEMRKLVTEQNYRDLGFQSVSEAASASLGDALNVFLVPLDRLKEYQSGSDAAALLTPLNQVVYQVNVNNQVRSSLTVEGGAGRWKAAAFGNAALARGLDQARKASPNLQGQQASSLQIVHVAALRLYFVAHRSENRLFLTPLTTVENYKLQAGVTLPAEEVFTNLVPIARNYNGQPL